MRAADDVVGPLKTSAAKKYAEKREERFANVVPAAGQEDPYSKEDEAALAEAYSKEMPALVESLLANGVKSVAIVSGSLQHETKAGAGARKTLGDLCANATDGGAVAKNAVRKASQHTERLLKDEEVSTWLNSSRVVRSNGKKISPRHAMKDALQNFVFYEVGPASGNCYATASRERLLQKAWIDHLKAHKECGLNILFTNPGMRGVTPTHHTLKRFDESITKKSKETQKLAAMAKGGFRFATRLVGVKGDALKHNDGWDRIGKRTSANPTKSKPRTRGRKAGKSKARKAGKT